MKLRPGMTKEKLFKDMTDKDWERIDAIKEAEERKVENEYAYKLFLETDQSVLTMKQLMSEVRNGVIHIRQTIEEVKDIKKKLATEDFADKSESELKTSLLMAENIINNMITNMKISASQIFRFFGTKRVDGEIILTEEMYNEFIEEINSKLEEVGRKFI